MGDNSKKPGIRFKGFTDDWEQRKFADYYKMSSGYAFKMTDYCDDGAGLINGESIQHGIISDDNLNHLPESFIEQYPEFVLKEGDIVVGLNRPITNGNLKIARIPSKYNNFMLYQRAGKIVYKAGCDKDFSYILLSQEILKHTLVEAVGSDQPFISTSKLDKWKIMMPMNIEEQEKIGVYFSNLDHIITLHQRKYDKLVVIKKSMLEKMFPKDGQTKPEIRFSGFTDDWEQRKLGDILVSLQNNTLSRADLSNKDGVAKNVHYGDILIKFGEVLDVSKESLPMISDEGVLTKYKSSYLQNGDVIVADTSEDSTVGKCSEIAGLNGEIVVSGLHTIPYRPVEQFASGYLGYYLNSSAYHSQLIPLMQGIKVTSISKSAVHDTDIIYPKAKEEQSKIGKYFQSLDHLITLHQRKVSSRLFLNKSTIFREN